MSSQDQKGFPLEVEILARELEDRAAIYFVEPATAERHNEMEGIRNRIRQLGYGTQLKVHVKMHPDGTMASSATVTLFKL